MKRLYIPLILIFLSILVIVVGLFWWRRALEPVSADQTNYRFVIPRGYSAVQIANSLKEKGLIKNALAFKFYTQLTGKSGKIQAGEFDLSPSYSMFRVVDTLLQGPVELWVTIPEGLRREEIAVRFADGLEKKGVERQSFIENFLEQTKDSEGFLFPDTYLFPKDAIASKVVGVLKNTFDTKISALQENVSSSGFSLNEIITLASLIERETKTDEERPVVAGIILKRLEAEWPLQIDASVQYVVADSDNWWPILNKSHLEINSKYNTYKFKGLPPGPIASPGLSSIEASLNPEESEYWFYLHDDKGKIYYAETIEEHNQNISKYLGK